MNPFINISQAKPGDIIHVRNDVLTICLTALSAIPNTKPQIFKFEGVVLDPLLKKNEDGSVTSEFMSRPIRSTLDVSIPILLVFSS